MQAVRAGIGRSLLPCFVGDREPGLKRLSGVALTREIWLMVHRDLRAHARIAAVIEFLGWAGMLMTVAWLGRRWREDSQTKQKSFKAASSS